MNKIKSYCEKCGKEARELFEVPTHHGTQWRCKDCTDPHHRRSGSIAMFRR